MSNVIKYEKYKYNWVIRGKYCYFYSITSDSFSYFLDYNLDLHQSDLIVNTFTLSAFFW